MYSRITTHSILYTQHNRALSKSKCVLSKNVLYQNQNFVCYSSKNSSNFVIVYLSANQYHRQRSLSEQ